MTVAFNDYMLAKTALDKLSDYGGFMNTVPESDTAEEGWGFEYKPFSGLSERVWCQNVGPGAVFDDHITLRTSSIGDPKQFIVAFKTKQNRLWNVEVGEGILCQLNEHCNIVGSSTISVSDQKDFLSKAINQIFSNGKNEVFEDGIKSNFSTAIDRIIKSYKNDACQLISDIIRSNRIESDLLCQTIRSMGALLDDETKQYRFEIIVPFLSHTSPFIRDCAGLGLYDMELIESIPYLKKAISVEPYKSLKIDFENIVRSLEELRIA